ncbi:MAG: glycosyltransferase [Rubritepida sp.]|nr:glycosyltransferase [Rubritepida sp.]
MPGAVELLVGLLAMRPDAGMVGARLLYPDGMQQEAGGILWADGSAWNYGRRDDPRKPEYGYVREADYISGAAIMLSRALWEQLGGFDEHYLPAYCEDSDLAFRVRAAGLKVLYQPEAMVIHHEGVSHGTDVTQGIKAYQVENQKKFLARWGDTLASGHYPNGTHVMRARDRAQARKVTLLVEHSVPEPDRDAGSRTILAFIDALIASGRVVKFWPENGFPTPGYTQALQARGVEVLHHPALLPTWLAQNGSELDEVLVARPSVAAWCLPLLAQHAPQAPVVFYGHDLHFQRLRKEAELTGDAAAAKLAGEVEAVERAVWRKVDLALYPSEAEARLAREMEPGARVGAIPPYVLAPSRRAAPRPPAAPTLLFVAGFQHRPNVDAAEWLVREILPRIRAAVPEARLALVGSKPSDAVVALANDVVEVTGFVPDDELARRYAGARVVLAPLRFGAGVKLKVIEALAEGVPVVTTPVGAEGIEGLDAVIDVADTPEALAAAAIRLLQDDALWAERVRAQTGFIAGRFSAEAMQRALDAAFEAAAARRAVLRSALAS